MHGLSSLSLSVSHSLRCLPKKMSPFSLKLSLILICLCSFALYSSASSINTDDADQESRILTPEIVDGQVLTWPVFLDNYIKLKKPVVMRKTYRSNMAYKLWSHDHLYYQPSSALTFYKTAGQSMSFRSVVKNRDDIVTIDTTLPWFLRADLNLPKCLDCDLSIKYLRTPFFAWKFHTVSDKIYAPKWSELLCVIRNRKTVHLLPEWNINMIGADGEDTLEHSDISYYKFDLNEGECAYLPKDFARFVKHRADGIDIRFFIEEEELSEDGQQHFDNCQSLGPSNSLDDVKFTDDLKDLNSLLYSKFIADILGLLGTKDENCVTEETFLNSFNYADYTPSQKETAHESMYEIFELLDANSDNAFCWNDIDSLSFEQVVRLRIGIDDAIEHLKDSVVLQNTTVSDDLQGKVYVKMEL